MSSPYFGLDRYVRPTDSSSRFCQFCFEQSLALTSKGVPNGRHKWTETDHARDRACRVDEGHDLRIIEQGRTDSPDSTSLHVPSIGLIVAGDDAAEYFSSRQERRL